MTERGILFSAPMVRALLDGTKTQTRRVVKPHPRDDAFVLLDHGDGWWPYRSEDGESANVDNMEYPFACPYGQPGDRLWVRETWGFNPDHPGIIAHVCYRADPGHEHDGITWKPSIHMPRAASRILLEIVSVRVERLQDTSRGDAMDEGCPFPNMAQGADPRQWYAELWENINGAGSWAANPWVWALEFRRIQP
ncbi:hypothetical protein IP91_00081 [Pseudoduganella lurida]|uniref:Morphogenetic protein n=1 Tax=Pseudoduganella lurida TaxID=1036180 RepID=A0A562RKQ5_9BURK|nr:hypothetical protein [Pseudoduganella lurida]TWI69016.1 hypothetical protein IP91_00081 [Pseudoduganella lurida]